ncbi:unnamed protein product [Spirodela intermedia]|uniref:Uncharacterized protein n=1 Tax=Spirodela intermedia TaxID=51605 RepID=A0A7I8LKZ3_SPIIN|nr:unnamed protein product [Spirodela intermedia]
MVSSFIFGANWAKCANSILTPPKWGQLGRTGLSLAKMGLALNLISSDVSDLQPQKVHLRYVEKFLILLLEIPMMDEEDKLYYFIKDL